MLFWILLAIGVLFTAGALVAGPRCCCRQPPSGLMGGVFLAAALAAHGSLTWWALYVAAIALTLVIEIASTAIAIVADAIRAALERRRKRPRVPRARARFTDE